MGGITAARGAFIIMGDADGSYDFMQIPRFLDNLRQGYDLVQGCRISRGRRFRSCRVRCRFASLVGEPVLLADSAAMVPCAYT